MNTEMCETETTFNIKTKTKEPIEHRIGNFYIISGEEEPFVLAQVAIGKFTLVGMYGNRYADPIEIPDNRSVLTEIEFDRLTCGEECKLIRHVTMEIEE